MQASISSQSSEMRAATGIIVKGCPRHVGRDGGNRRGWGGASVFRHNIRCRRATPDSPDRITSANAVRGKTAVDALRDVMARRVEVTRRRRGAGGKQKQQGQQKRQAHGRLPRTFNKPNACGNHGVKARRVFDIQYSFALQGMKCENHQALSDPCPGCFPRPATPSRRGPDIQEPERSSNRKIRRRAGHVTRRRRAAHLSRPGEDRQRTCAPRYLFHSDGQNSCICRDWMKAGGWPHIWQNIRKSKPGSMARRIQAILDTAETIWIWLNPSTHDFGFAEKCPESETQLFSYYFRIDL